MLTYVIPTQNSEPWIEKTIQRIETEIGAIPGSEMIIVENGSSDGTPQKLSNLMSNTSNRVVLMSATNYGEAIRKGVAAARNSRVIVSADDLPFGFSDLAEFDKCASPICLGSKMHLDSRVAGRLIQRRLLTKTSVLLTRLLLGIDNEVNGTLQLQGEGLDLILKTREKGFAINLELFVLAKKRNLKTCRVPVIYDAQADVTRVKLLKDSYSYLRSILKLRGRFSI